MIRAFARRSARTLGNFWVDLTRVTLYVLLHACIALTLVFVALGVPQTLGPYVTATTLEGHRRSLARMFDVLDVNNDGFLDANELTAPPR